MEDIRTEKRTETKDEPLKHQIYKFGLKFVIKALKDLKANLEDGNFDSAKFLLRFLANSLNYSLIEPKSFLALIEKFAQIPKEASAYTQAKADWYTYIILYCLPHCGKILASHDEKALDCLFGSIEQYLEGRSRAHVKLLRVWDTDVPHPQEDVDHIKSNQEYGPPHSFLPISPPDSNAKVPYPLPRVIFRIFDHSDVLSLKSEEKIISVLPGANSIERFFVDDYMQILIESCSYNRVVCARALLSLKTKSTFPIEYIIVEQVLGSMFQLPEPAVTHGQLLFYGALLIQICNECSSTFPLVLAQATELLFERLNQMKPICIERFVNWFSYHLVNYQILWTWNEWADALEENRMSPKKRFIVETFARLIRSCKFRNLKNAVPEEFQVLLPESLKFNNIFNDHTIDSNLLKYSNISPVFERFYPCIEKREDPLLVIDTLKKLCSQFDSECEPSDSEMKTHYLPSKPPRTQFDDEDNLIDYIDDDVETETVISFKTEKTHIEASHMNLFITALFYCGQSSLSAAISLINRYDSVFKWLLPEGDIDAQVDCLQVWLEFN
ncbi:Nuclear cap-binding protein subunit 1 [Cichlidogyrus casuarinus]|uniref:Nuclear cap-binding protein subunit 1 n=1 Tax=Cichlidogyrus casuarinus TaxID=1844966 RepID=A0ABD2Q204_9PLAT